MNLRRIIRPFVAPAITFVLVLALCGIASACPTCASGLDQGDEASERMISGWFWSIVFMMSMPFTILGCLSGYMYYLVRKARVAAEHGSPSDMSGILPQPVKLAVDAG